MSSIQHNPQTNARHINLQVKPSNDVRLSFNDMAHNSAVRIRELSASGLFIEGKYDCCTSDSCQVTINHNRDAFSITLDLPAKIARIATDGIALEFIDPDSDTLLLLETLAMFYSDDSMTEDAEPGGNLPFCSDLKWS